MYLTIRYRLEEPTRAHESGTAENGIGGASDVGGFFNPYEGITRRTGYRPTSRFLATDENPHGFKNTVLERLSGLTEREREIEVKKLLRNRKAYVNRTYGWESGVSNDPVTSDRYVILSSLFLYAMQMKFNECHMSPLRFLNYTH